MIDSRPESRVHNSQPAGIGRIVPLGDGCAWNNLGRNVVFADSSLRPRGIFGDTEFPEDDEESQFDLDVHAIVELVAARGLAILNHLGILRIFPPLPPTGLGSDTASYLTPSARLEFIADVERITILGDRLVTSQPRSKRLDGVLVTAPVTSATERLEAEGAQESFGFVNALAACSTADGTGWIALGGENRVRLVNTDRGRLGVTRWDAEIGFLATAVVECGTTLWVAGSSSGGTDLDDYDWEQLKGGGLAQLDAATGDVIRTGIFGADLGWGSGGAPFVVADGVPCGVGRLGEVHALGFEAKVTAQVTEKLASHSLGIAHAAVVGDQILFGFNRGGYQLHTVPLPTVRRLRQGPQTDRS